ncbi:jg10356 [Pararge aegeria aegeria]|uniref:Jg10356 protein n=1 Tax=Pararge aegeria aegeria TaxID=348720 RepID=A0A8S4SN30_9NEOP|nr:jg10356 [Pararge aegeria aegeria]
MKERRTDRTDRYWIRLKTNLTCRPLRGPASSSKANYRVAEVAEWTVSRTVAKPLEINLHHHQCTIAVAGLLSNRRKLLERRPTTLPQYELASSNGYILPLPFLEKDAFGTM